MFRVLFWSTQKAGSRSWSLFFSKNVTLMECVNKSGLNSTLSFFCHCSLVPVLQGTPLYSLCTRLRFPVVLLIFAQPAQVWWDRVTPRCGTSPYLLRQELCSKNTVAGTWYIDYSHTPIHPRSNSDIFIIRSVLSFAIQLWPWRWLTWKRNF